MIAPRNGAAFCMRLHSDICSVTLGFTTQIHIPKDCISANCSIFVFAFCKL